MMKDADTLRAFRALSQAHDVIDTTLMMGQRCMNRGPTADQQDAITRASMNLEAARVRLRSAMVALGTGKLAIDPTALQRDSFHALSGRVRQLAAREAPVAEVVGVVGDLTKLLYEGQVFQFGPPPGEYDP